MSALSLAWVLVPAHGRARGIHTLSPWPLPSSSPHRDTPSCSPTSPTAASCPSPSRSCGLRKQSVKFKGRRCFQTKLGTRLTCSRFRARNALLSSLNRSVVPLCRPPPALPPPPVAWPGLQCGPSRPRPGLLRVCVSGPQSSGGGHKSSLSVSFLLFPSPQKGPKVRLALPW